MTENPKFLADGMLGKLSRWLRILGYNVEYRPDEVNSRLAVLAEKAGRILLTSDLELYRKAAKSGVQAFLVDGANEAEKLARLSRRFNLSLNFDSDASRCPICNSPLTEASHEETCVKVAPSTLKRYSRFWVCANPHCRKVYWQGSHWRKIKEILKEAKQYVVEE